MHRKAAVELPLRLIAKRTTSNFPASIKISKPTAEINEMLESKLICFVWVENNLPIIHFRV
ncbi:hypothetical protein NCCP2331_09990 [Sporosarcina sp. NCCP-2331]|nr:hypothetical protein NCCP2331_09990 [Sporosarcina sp. NCCP-2331]GLB54956.1 hypothetical protein NCCP2378_07410 [Sporosarcina sp. NCCP-2378]